VVSSALGIAWSRTFVVAVAESRGVGAAGRTDGGQVIIFDPADGSILAAFDTGGFEIRDLDFDAAGNLLTTNETDQHVRMWSPPDGSNSFTITYLDVMNIGPDASPDCNDNNVPDETDITVGTSEDCNSNAVPDECDIESGQSWDCNGNDVPDSCDLAFGDSSDCNTNGIPDGCDIAVGTSPDCDSNGWPDGCDLHPGGQVVKLLASDAEAFQEFGNAIAIEGDYAVVGVPRSGVGGAAYVLRRFGSTWIEQQRLVASDAEEFDRFGQSVAICGRCILSGAPGATMTPGPAPDRRTCSAAAAGAGGKKKS
jgi:hypothetical protein